MFLHLNDLLLFCFWNKVSSSLCWLELALPSRIIMDFWFSHLLNAGMLGCYHAKFYVVLGSREASCMLGRHSASWATSLVLQPEQLTLLFLFLNHFLLPMQDRQHHQQQAGGHHQSRWWSLTWTKAVCMTNSIAIICWLCSGTSSHSELVRVHSPKLVGTEVQREGHLKVKRWWVCHRKAGSLPQVHQPTKALPIHHSHQSYITGHVTVNWTKGPSQYIL